MNRSKLISALHLECTDIDLKVIRLYSHLKVSEHNRQEKEASFSKFYKMILSQLKNDTPSNIAIATTLKAI
jgi:hypothetical protein